jgi:hypothetical protein
MKSEIDFWKCPYWEYDETYDDETGDVVEYYQCGHPDADVSEVDYGKA